MLQKLQNPLDSALLTRYSLQKSNLKQQIEADIQNRKSELKKPPIIQKKTGQEVDVLENPEIPVPTTDNGKSFFIVRKKAVESICNCKQITRRIKSAEIKIAISEITCLNLFLRTPLIVPTSPEKIVEIVLVLIQFLRYYYYIFIRSQKVYNLYLQLIK